jgi:hypothetical protein
VAQLDDDRLAADRVGAAVQDVRGGGAAGEISIDVDVGRVEHVFHPGHRAHRHAALVDGFAGDVRMGVDDPWRDELAGAVIDLGARGNRHVAADRGDLAVAHQHGAIGDGPLGRGDDGRVPDRDDCRRGDLGGKRQGHLRAHPGQHAEDCAERKTA